ncbi:F-box domain containing protein [Trema orientale]|uniref:F-box domain containing protein n=1 Tax=Trema orientale TaxID=63057 RepID=A0A2P5BEG1_TREOI|nr:F-box domain containing protein [Trema orientale]
MASGFCGFSQDVLEEILSWLPPESLMQSKLVSKSWYALISSLVKNPIFVSKHLHNIDKRIFSSSTCIVFCCTRPGYWPDPRMFSSVTISNDFCENDRLEYTSEYFKVPFISSGGAFHCNGIVCLAGYDGTLMLCNPAINEYRTLPKPFLTGEGFFLQGAGFGYDSRANDYKVVRFGFFGFPVENIEAAEVYSLESDSWREIEVHVEFGGLPFIDRGVFCQGVFYWLISTNDDYLILSFDISDEVFHSIALPDNLPVTLAKEIKLAVWNESIALFFCLGEREAPRFIELWVLDDRSWIKKLTIGPLDGIATACAFWKNDELLLQETVGGIVSYNLHSQRLRNLTIRGVESVRHWECLYVKSLVSMRGGNQARADKVTRKSI